MKEPRSLSPTSPMNLDALIVPVDGPGGTGPDLRFDPTYKAIIEARREENARLPQGVWAHDVKRADWPTVERLCTDILRARSKDLQVACWLSEAVVHQTGFAGIAPGLRLLAALCRRFWPDLHPAIDDDDIGPRLAPFEWLNARFPPMLRNLPIVCSVPNPEEVFTWTDYKNAQLLEKLRQSDPKSVERSEAAGAVSLAAFTALRGRTETQFWRDINVSLTAATAALAELNATLEETCGRDAPGLGGIGEAISEILNVTSIALAERQPKPFSLLRRATVSPVLAVAERTAPVETPQSHSAILSREDAYAQLAEIADFLQRLEPHSPVPHLIRCAVAWGDMSFAELVMTFSSAGLDLGKVFEVLGLARMAGAPDDLEEADREN